MWHRSAVALGLSYFALTGNISVENPSLLFPLDIYTGSLSSNPHSTLQATYSFPATSPVECRGSSKDRLPRSDPQSGSACACRWNSSWHERRQPYRAERLGIRRFYQALEFSPLLCFPNVLPAGLPASPIISIVVRYLHLLSLQLSNLGTTSQGEGRLGCLRSAMGIYAKGNTGGSRMGAEDLPICMYPEPKIKKYYFYAAKEKGHFTRYGKRAHLREHCGSQSASREYQREVGAAARADSLELRPKPTSKAEDPNAGFC